jgi:glycosyltransferase involved in cell wall biosynthesis
MHAMIYAWLHRRAEFLKSPSSTRSPLGDSLRESFVWFYKQFLCFPDELWPWYILEYSAIENICRLEKPHVLLSSSPPGTCHIIASNLSRRLKIPWVADFRDLWTQNYIARRIWPLRLLEEWIERSVILQSSALTTVSEILKRDLEAIHKKPVFVVYNGFDPEDLPKIERRRLRKLTITYTGAVYPQRNPNLLFTAVSHLISTGEVHKDEIEIKFYGHKLEYVREISRNYPNLQGILRIIGDIPHNEALRIQQESHILLLLEWTNPLAKGVYTGKVFEYLAANRPILSIGPKDGVLAKLIRETMAGVHVHTVNEVKEVLRRWLKEWRDTGDIAWQGVSTAIAQYNRKEQTGKLVEVLNCITGPGAHDAQ